MNADALIAEARVGGGGALLLYQGRLIHRGNDVTETIPLAQLASVRIAFEREAGKLGGAIALGLLACMLFLVAGPLRAWLADLAGKVVEPGRRESLDSLLHSIFTGLAAIAGAIPGIAAILLAVGVLLAALWVYGRTSLVLCFAATERVHSVRGRNAALLEFADALGARLAALAGAR